MTDLLRERLDLIADLTDDGDWLDVRRRARTRRRLLAPATVAAVFMTLVAVAVAAGYHWRSSEGKSVTLDPNTGSITHIGTDVRAVTTVEYNGKPWRVTMTLSANRTFTQLLRPNGTVAAASSGADPSVASLRPRDPLTYTTFMGSHGTVVFGVASSQVMSVRLSDRNHSWSTPTVGIGKQLQTAARVWAIAIPDATVTRLEALDSRGKIIARRTLKRISPRR